MGAREREAVLLPTTHREESIRPPPRTPEIRSARGNPTPNPSLDLPGSDGGAVAARRPVRGTRARHGARRRRRVLPVDGFNAVGGGGGCCPSSDIFNISSDTEVILHLIATSLSRPLLARICDACERLAGAYLLLWSLSSRRCEVLSRKSCISSWMLEVPVVDGMQLFKERTPSAVIWIRSFFTLRKRMQH